MQPLLRFVGKAAAKWRQIGVALGFQPDVLNVIEEENRGKPFNCFTDLLSRWLKWAPPKHKLPTLETLADALREGTVGEERVAYNLEQDFQHTCKIRTDHWHKKQGGWGAGEATPPMIFEWATTLSYCTTKRYCEGALAENFSSCTCIVCSNSMDPF